MPFRLCRRRYIDYKLYLGEALDDISRETLIQELVLPSMNAL